jgi:hypothetical protein
MPVHLSILCMSYQVNTTSNLRYWLTKANLRIRFFVARFLFFKFERLIFLFFRHSSGSVLEPGSSIFCNAADASVPT